MKLYNDIDNNIFMKHLRSAYYETLEKKYTEKNYKVFQEHIIMPGLRVDFVAIKDNDMIIYEIKSGKMTQEQKDRLCSIKEYVENHNKNAKFNMIFLNPPQSKEIEFEKLQEIICHHLWGRDTPAELDILSTHTEIKGVSGIEIDHLEIKDDVMNIQGNGIVEVSLQAGSSKEAREDDSWYDCFPFEFEITLNDNFLIEEANYKFDTDSYYE